MRGCPNMGMWRVPMAKSTPKKAKAKEAVHEPVASAGDSKDAGGKSTAGGRRKADVLVALIGLPLLVLLAYALIDGHKREQEGPLRAAIGATRLDELMAGEGGTPHYLGYERMAPDVEFTRPDGTTWSLRDQRGKVVVMNFWSITCRPCIEEMPSVEMLAQMADQRFGGNVEVVAVSTDAGWDAVSGVLPPNPTLNHLFDPDKSIVEGVFGTQLYPETWIVDADGVIRFRYDGARDWASPIMLDVIQLFL